MVHSALHLAIRILTLYCPLLWSYTSKSVWRSSTTSRYIHLFIDNKRELGGYDIESLFTNTDIQPLPQQQQPQPLSQQSHQQQQQQQPSYRSQLPRTEQSKKWIDQKKPRYNPTNENKKSKYSTTKMRLRSNDNMKTSFAGICSISIVCD